MRVLLLLFALSTLVLVVRSLSQEETAVISIKKELQKYKGIGQGSGSASPLCDVYSCCVISETESCDIPSLVTDDPSKKQNVGALVFPSLSSSKCIFGEPYALQYFPGPRSDQVLFYFQGGGACWTQGTTNAELCTTQLAPQEARGVFDRSNPSNPFANYSIVHFLYCSGDVWGGNVTQPYTARGGETVTQVGIVNAQMTIDYVKQQQQKGYLPSTFSDLLVMGCSAGSVGAQLWGNIILETFAATRAAVIPDSYAGVFPEGTIGPLMRSFGFCSSSVPKLLPSVLQQQCDQGTLTIQQVVANRLLATPFPYAFIQSKVDDVQQSFYWMVGITAHVDPVLTPHQFYGDVNGIFGNYNRDAAFLTYLVDGWQHCFTDTDVMYNTSAIGKDTANEANAPLPLLPAWLASFPVEASSNASSVCVGAREHGADVGSRDRYCSSSVVPKIFFETSKARV